MANIFKSIAKHSAIYGIGDFLGKAIGFLLIPLYTNYLSASEYGILELIGLITFLVALFFGAGISRSISRFYYEYREDEQRSLVIGNALIFIWVAGTISLLILAPLSQQISYVVFETEAYSSFFALAFFSTVMQLSSEVGLTVLRVRERSLLYVGTGIGSLMLSLAMNIYFVAILQIGVVGILLSTLISSSIKCAFLLIYCLRTVSGKLDFKILKEMLAYGAPLILGGIAMLSLHFSDRFILQRFTTLADIGIYALAYKFGMLPNFFIVSPFMRYWGVKQYDIGDEQETKETISRVFTYFTTLNCFVSLGIAALVGDIIRLISHEDFHGAALYAPMLVIAYLISGCHEILSYGMLYAKKTKLVAYANTSAALGNIALNFALIPFLGVLGACLATLLAFAFHTGLSYYFAQKEFALSLEWNRLAKIVLCFTALLCAALFINTGNLWLNVVLKFSVSLSFPVCLWLSGYFSEEELDFLRVKAQLLKKFKS